MRYITGALSVYILAATLGTALRPLAAYLPF